MNVRLLESGDIAALEDFLKPTAPRSLFLLGNARQHGLVDEGGPLQGRWVGAFSGGRMVGVAAWFRGPDSLIPACDGHAAAILPLLLASLSRPRVVIGTAERVAEVLPHLPWAVRNRQRERLLVLRWTDYRPRRLEGVGPAREEEIPEVAERILALDAEVGLPADREKAVATASRLVVRGDVQVARDAGAIQAISCEAAATGRWVHVGATFCRPETRRRGLAGACVCAVLDRAREAGRASDGAALFTGRDNEPALRLYERLGFRLDADWEMAFLA